MGVKRLAVEHWIPVVLWLLVIFIFSSDSFSADETSGFIIPLLKFFFPFLSFQELHFWHGVIRKAGHVTEYFILAFFTYRSLTHHEPNLIQAKMVTLSFVFLAASADEIHQRFTNFRTGSAVDVGYDCLGAVFALWLFTIYETWRLRTHPVL
jgi:VanZ family protein